MNWIKKLKAAFEVGNTTQPITVQMLETLQKKDPQDYDTLQPVELCKQNTEECKHCHLSEYCIEPGKKIWVRGVLTAVTKG